jgi:hypothetical protein
VLEMTASETMMMDTMMMMMMMAMIMMAMIMMMMVVVVMGLKFFFKFIINLRHVYIRCGS